MKDATILIGRHRAVSHLLYAPRSQTGGLPSEVPEPNDHTNDNRPLQSSGEIPARPRQLRRDTRHEASHDKDGSGILARRSLRRDEQGVPNHRYRTPSEDERAADVLLVRQVGHTEGEDAGRRVWRDGKDLGARGRESHAVDDRGQEGGK